MAITSDGTNVAPAAIEAMTKGLEIMGAQGTDVIVTDDFVDTVQDLTGDDRYHADRGGGSVAARTTTTTAGSTVVVANWPVLQERSLAEIERVMAHEAGHVLIDARDVDPLGLVGDKVDNYWEELLASIFLVAVDEFRCEASVYKAGYPVEEGRTDPFIADMLFGLNLQLLRAETEYQQHRDVDHLRDDVGDVLTNQSKFLACIAARHLHKDPFHPSQLAEHPRENWSEYVGPTWPQFCNQLGTVPDATTAWPVATALELAIGSVPLMHSLTNSLGFKGEPEHFWIIANRTTWAKRLARANAEAAVLGIN